MSAGNFMMIEGMDGAGKGTIADILRDELHARKIPTFDVRAFEKDHETLPSLADLGAARVCFTAEPTFSMVGKAIRERLIATDSEFHPLTIAHAYGVDREVLYKSLLLPAREKGMHIVQERGVVSSLVFQSLYGRLTKEIISAIPGNAFCLGHAPTHLVIATVQPKLAVQRVRMRAKQDDSMFETEEVQAKIFEEYRAPWLRDMFEQRGTRVLYFDSSGSMDETVAFAKTLVHDLLY